MTFTGRRKIAHDATANKNILNASDTKTPLHSAPQFNKVSRCWGLRFVSTGLKTPKIKIKIILKN